MGVIVNTIAVFIGGLIGLLLNKGIPEKVGDTIMKGIALVVIIIGVDGALVGESTIIQVISIVVGAVIGESLDIDHFFNSKVRSLEKKFPENDSGVSFSEGFITTTMLMCVGSMTIIGSLEVGLTGNSSTLYTKSVIDGISAVIFGSSLGYGVIFTSLSILVVQGGLAIFASFLAPFLAEAVVAEIIAVGSLLLIGLGFNMLNLTNLKILNYIPAMVIPALIMVFL